MTKPNPAFLFLSGLLFLSLGFEIQAAPDDHPTPILLQRQWRPGFRYLHRVDTTNHGLIRIPGRSVPGTQDVTLSQDYEIDVPRDVGNRLELSLTIRRVKMEVAVDGSTTVSLDTSGQASDFTDNPMTSVFRKLAGSKLTFTLDSSNRVGSIEGVTGLVQKALASTSGSGREAVRSIFTEQYFQRMVDPAEYFPPQPAVAGATWTNQTGLSIRPGQQVTVQLGCRLRGWESLEQNRCLRIEFSGPLAPKDAANAALGSSGLNIKQGMLSGTAWFDPELKMARKTDLRVTLKLSAAAADPNAGTNTASSSVSTEIDEVHVFKLLKAGVAR